MQLLCGHATHKQLCWAAVQQQDLEPLQCHTPDHSLFSYDSAQRCEDMKQHEASADNAFA